MAKSSSSLHHLFADPSSSVSSELKTIAVNLAFGFGGMTLLLAALYSALKQRCLKKLLPKSFIYQPVSNDWEPIIFQRSIDPNSIAFLQNDNAIDGLEVIGRGGCGQVYKATLNISNKDAELALTKTVAIKKVKGICKIMNKTSTKKKDEGESEYICLDGPEESIIDVLTENSAQTRAEMNTLGHVRHRNLVTLLAYVPKPNMHFLIYDYMANGSLNDALTKARQGALNLDWPMRYAIALGVAKGLKYLHNDAKPRIIHRDLKPGNILLDEAMEAHIGDFGLAKLILDDATHVRGSNWAGTIGYVGPEMLSAFKYTDKGDIYAFGVILVVILTNRQPNDSMFEHRNHYMGGWVADTLNATSVEHIVDKFDKRLLGQGFEEQMLLTLRIASFCLAKLPTARPSSIEVLEMLTQVVGTPMK